jgi:hypothetical protein
MTKTASKIRFKAKLCRPAESGKTRSWIFLVLPKNASAKLPSRGITGIEGTLNGCPFQAILEPDGQKRHWLKVDRKLSEAAGAEAGDVVTLDIAPAAEEPEPAVPSDLRKALAAAAPKARALWSEIAGFLSCLCRLYHHPDKAWPRPWYGKPALTAADRGKCPWFSIHQQMMVH